jgi:catechol 2,3-dioxygenase-like lactoylglutathione lyase family enzyme
MKKRIALIGLSLLFATSPSWGQLTRADLLRNLIELKPNDAGVSLGQWSTIVRDVDASKRFWALLGGTPDRIDGVDVMRIHGVVIFLKPGEPSGGSVGTTIDHPGIRVPDGLAMVMKLKAAGVKTDPDAGTQRAGYQGMGWGNVYSPDGLKVEIIGDSNLALPAASDHIHFFVTAAAGPEMQTWYSKTFGAPAFTDVATNPTNPAPTVDIPGIQLKFGKAANTPGPTKGRALDHIGFEIRNLDAFCKKLQTEGVKFDEPFSKTRHPSFASAMLTDPWGTSIELTEGLTRLASR